MHPHPLLFRSRGENLLQNNFSFLSFSVKITFVSQAFPGQVHCSTSKHKDCWKRRAKKTGDFFLHQSAISDITEETPIHHFLRMLEEAVSTLKEQVNIYEQEVDQVNYFLLIWHLNETEWNFQIKEQSRIKESNFEEEISILKTQVNRFWKPGQNYQFWVFSGVTEPEADGHREHWDDPIAGLSWKFSFHLSNYLDWFWTSSNSLDHTVPFRERTKCVELKFSRWKPRLFFYKASVGWDTLLKIRS